MIALTDAQFVAVFGFLGTLVITIGGFATSLLIKIHRNTNSLVKKLILNAEEKADKKGYDRAKQEEKDKGE
jgi:hypothetical protein